MLAVSARIVIDVVAPAELGAALAKCGYNNRLIDAAIDKQDDTDPVTVQLRRRAFGWISRGVLEASVAVPICLAYRNGLSRACRRE